MMPMDIPVVTIDGPSGTGKGTVSLLLAHALKWHFLDSGALYRVLALAAKLHAVDLSNDKALEVLAAHLDVQFKAQDHEMDETARIVLEGNDVTDIIRTEECGNAASRISVFPNVRTALLERQRAFRELPGLVTDGRDMGTVVFPDAFLKIFLQATPEVRAQRRYLQLKEKGINVSLTQVKEELAERDERDQRRLVAPLMPAADAITIDTTTMSIQQVLSVLLKEVNARHITSCVGDQSE